MSPIYRRRIVSGLALFLAVFFIYSMTRAPGLTWAHRGADGGDFIAAAATLGIPHPPGYPTYTLLLWLLMQLPIDDPASAGNLFSTIMGAVSATLCYGITRQILESNAQGRHQRRWIPWAAASAGLTCAFFPLIWSQALITEVYTFHLALVSMVLWLLLRWRRTGKGLFLASFAFGIGLTHHSTIAFVLPAGAMLLVAGRKHLFRKNVELFREKGSAGSGAKFSAQFQFAGALGKLDYGKLLQVVVALCVGLLPFIYLPWAAHRMPPINWENPQNLDNLGNLVLAARYRHNLLEPTPTEIIARVTKGVQDYSTITYWPLILLVIGGLFWLLLRDPATGSMTGILATLATGYALGYGTSDFWVNLIPVLLVIAIWSGIGVWQLMCRIARWRYKYSPILTVMLALIIPLALLLTQWTEMDISDDREATLFVQDVLHKVEPNALIFAKGDRGIFGLWYARYAIENKVEWIPILPTFLRSSWYRDTLAANHKGLDLDSSGLGHDALQTMLERNMGHRTIFLTWEDEETKKHYWLVKDGTLWRVEKISSGPVP